MWSQKQISPERYNVIMERFRKYQENLNDPDKEPVNVFDPLSPEILKELELIREVSRELQAKKEEDMRKIAQAKEEEKLAQEKEKETKEEPKEEEKEESKKEE